MRLGEFDISNEVDQPDCVTSIGGGSDCTEGAVVIPIEKVIPHPDHDIDDTKTRRHDIALIRMSASAPYSGKLILTAAHRVLRFSRLIHIGNETFFNRLTSTALTRHRTCKELETLFV